MAINRNVRKFIDLARQISAKWANWDPPVPVTVGDYGTLDENGELIVEGNVYDPDISTRTQSASISVPTRQSWVLPSRTTSQLPLVSGEEILMSIKACGLVIDEDPLDCTLNMLPPRVVPELASASIKGTWKFRDGKHGALIIVHQPREKSIPKHAQKKILEAKLIEGKKVVVSALVCPAYLFYLSDGTEESFSVALRGTDASELGAVTSELGFGWWTSNERGQLRRAFNPEGENSFPPLFSLNVKGERGLKSRDWWRAGNAVDPDGTPMWQEVYQPWKPLDEDGEEIDY